MSALLYRYLIPAPTSAQPPQVNSSWPTVSAYNGVQNQGVSGSDSNDDYIFVTSSSVYQWTLANTVNKRKASTLFYYGITPDGDFSSNTSIASSNYDYTQTSWLAFRQTGANPAQKMCVAVNRVQGTDTFNSFSNTWNSSTTATSAVIYYHNGSNWTSTGAGAVWQQKPVWNDAGTHVVGATTAQTGANTNGVVVMSTWNGTSVTATNTYTLPNGRYIQNYLWVNDFLLIKASDPNTTGNVLYVYERSGSTLSYRSQASIDTLAGVGTNVNLGIGSPDPTNNRAFFPVAGSSATTNLNGLVVNVDNLGVLTGTAILGDDTPVNPPALGVIDIWSAFPVKYNRLFHFFSQTNAQSRLYATNPSGANQIPFVGSSVLGNTRNLVKAHVPSGSVVMVNTGGAYIYKFP